MLTPAFLRFWLGAGLLLAASGCSIFHRHRHRDEPTAAVVETVPTPPPAPAPATPTPPTAARDLAGAMTTVLHLRPTQTAQVRQILAATVAQANAARKRYASQPTQLTAALRRINASSDDQLRQALGPVTYKAMQTKRAQIQAQMQQR